mgnify:CR=1 FL=1
MTKFVFFGADEGQVSVEVDKRWAGAASTAQELADLLVQHSVDVDTATMYFGSSVDFASEEGFATDCCAHDIIDAALDLAA